MSTALHGKLAASPSTIASFVTDRDVVDVHGSDLTDVAAVILSVADLRAGWKEQVESTGFGLPVFAMLDDQSLDLPDLSGLTGVLQLSLIHI